MGAVYLGQDASGVRAAIKMIHPGMAEDDHFRVRFAREVEAAKRIHGAHTAAVLNADVDADPPWMATAYVAGSSLSETVATQGPLSDDALLGLGKGLVMALTAIHDAGLIHRDLKPGNVMIAIDGPRVIDFGIARIAEATTVTATGTVMGTPGYMAPEQVTGGAVSPATDIFAFGAVMAFAGLGHGPFGRATVPELLRRTVQEEPDLSQVPPWLRSLVARCLAKDPKARPALWVVAAELGVEPPPPPTLPPLTIPATTRVDAPNANAPNASEASSVAVQATMTALQKAPEGSGARRGRGAQEATAAPPVEQGGLAGARQGVTRRRLLLGAGGGLAMAALGAGGWLKLTARAGSGGGESPLWQAALPPAVPSPIRNVSPQVSGTTLYAFPNQAVYALGLADGRQLWTQPPGGVPAVSADGRLAVIDGAMFVLGDAVVALDAATGRQLWSTSVETMQGLPLLAGPDSLYSIETSGTVFALDARSGKRRWTYTLKGDTVSTLLLSPTTVYGVGRSIYAIDLAKGTLRWRHRPPSSALEYAAAVLGADALYAPCSNADMYVLDAQSGAQRWATVDQPAGDRHMPNVAFDTRTLLVGTEGYGLTAYDSATGAVRWRVGTGGRPDAVVPGGALTYYTVGSRLVAVDSATGATRWSMTGGAGPTPPLLSNGVLYARGPSSLLALDPATGRQQAGYRTGGDPVAFGVAAGFLYASLADGRLMAFQTTKQG